jgi:hypothetical protein
LAFANADLERLNWAWNGSFGDNKNDRYKSALEAFVKSYGEFEISALALENEARVFQQEDDFVKAHQLALRGGVFLQYDAGEAAATRTMIPELIRHVLASVIVVKQRGIETAAVQVQRIGPFAVDGRTGD